MTQMGGLFSIFHLPSGARADVLQGEAGAGVCACGYCRPGVRDALHVRGLEPRAVHGGEPAPWKIVVCMSSRR
jgi:hypothetical protein